MSCLLNLVRTIRTKTSYAISQIGLDSSTSTSWKHKVLHEDSTSLFNSENICFFSHYSIDGEINEGLIDYLKELQTCGFQTLFCTTSSSLSETSLNKLKSLCPLIIQRENIGLDFGSWSTIHKYLVKQKPHYWKNLNRILIANDSVLGPFKKISKTLDRQDLSNADFWGMTESRELRWHLQSYFICFNKPVVQSGALTNFLDQIQLFNNKRKIIYSYELGLSRTMKDSKFHGVAAFPEEKIHSLAKERSTLKHSNPTIIYWDVLARDLEFPFLKKQVLRDNPGNVLRYGDPKEIIPSLKI